MEIRILPSAIAEKIAAGEVIERPASAVKELVENALDASSTEIEVRLEDGGKDLIEITDNGSGMSEKDLAICVKRHATSKLRTLDDLDKINTLGFRGEALPSVAAASDLRIISRAKTSTEAFELSPQQHRPKPITFGHFNGSANGTKVEARSIFSQIPARFKFLKSASAEISNVREWIERLALGHAGVGFKLFSGEKLILNFRPETEESRVRSVLSNSPNSHDYNVVHGSGQFDFGTINFYWLQGLGVPSSKKLIQIVNKRAVKDKMLNQAILTPFRQLLMPGEFPAVVLFLTIDPALIDVNVHPTKTELRFLENGKIFHAIESLISKNTRKDSSIFLKASDSITETPSFFIPSPMTPSFDFKSSTASIASNETILEPQNNIPLLFVPESYVGTVFSTYLLFDLGDELGLIDQHAAHERVRYEAIKKTLFTKGRLTSQQLLIPEAVQFRSEVKNLVEERIPWLNDVGFEVEIFGEDTLLFRAVPSEIGSDSLRIRLQNLIEKLTEQSAENKELLLDQNLFETLASEACHSAVRAGKKLTSLEVRSLIESLSLCENPWNCPHGRPTIVKLSKTKFEELFKRKL